MVQEPEVEAGEVIRPGVSELHTLHQRSLSAEELATIQYAMLGVSRRASVGLAITGDELRVVSGCRIDLGPARSYYRKPRSDAVESEEDKTLVRWVFEDSGVQPASVPYEFRWAQQARVRAWGNCDGVTHVAVRAEFGAWVDGGKYPRCPRVEDDVIRDTFRMRSDCRQPIALDAKSVDLDVVSATVDPWPRPTPGPMVKIAGGDFNGARVDEFWIDVYEVGREEYSRCEASGICEKAQDIDEEGVEHSDEEGNGLPAEADGASEYCTWVGKRVPTLKEWQWAARGREEGRTRPWGEELPDRARVNALGRHHEAALSEAVARRQGKKVVMHSDGAESWGQWKLELDVRGSRPLGESRDGVRDLVGNVYEHAITSKGIVRVGGSIGTPLPDHSSTTTESEGPFPYREEMLRALSAEADGSEEYHRWSAGGIRCVADDAPGELRLPEEFLEHESGTAWMVRGLRSQGDAFTTCADASWRELSWRVATRDELKTLITDREHGVAMPYWTAGRKIWKLGGRAVRPRSDSATARVVCVVGY